jgi:hydrogenase maturation protease
MRTENSNATLVLGIGNLLMGDEGIGVHVVRRVERLALPEGVQCLDGGTGSFVLLEPMQAARRIVLIDATVDGLPAGTVRRLEPRFSAEYPRTLTAHDIGLKDLLDAFHMLGSPAEVVLFAVSIAPLHEMGDELTPALAAHVDEIVRQVVAEVAAPRLPKTGRCGALAEVHYA